MKEHKGLILKVFIGLVGAVVGISILTETIPLPFEWGEIPVGLVSLLATPIYFFIDFLIKRKKEHSTKSPTDDIMEISPKTDFSGEYFDSNNIIQNVVQGYVYLGSGVASVGFPPFEEPPAITFIGSKDSMPNIIEVTKDSFQIYANNSGAQGKWKWSAKGKLLKKVDCPALK